MEQKRTLWIIAAVGVFLLVVIGFALIITSPSQATESSIASLQVQNDTWTLPYTATGLNQPTHSNVYSGGDAINATATVPSGINQPNAETGHTAVQTPVDGVLSVDNMTVYSGTTNVQGTGTTTIDLNTLKYTAPTQTSSVTAVNQAAADAVSSAASSKTTPEVSASIPVVAETMPVATASSTKTTPPVSTSTPSSSTSTKTTASVAKPASPAKTTLPDQYWVQAASFTSKANAEAARSALAANKIESEIFTYTDSKGKTYYRLRVGPYTTKTEAEYWRSRLVLIDEFSDSQSYVTNSSAKKQ